MEPNIIYKAGAIIRSRVDTNKILLIYTGSKKDWSFPKGHMEVGETPVQTMLREVKEETGLSVSVNRPLEPITYIHPDGRQILIHMLDVTSEDDSQLKKEKDTDELKWVSVSEAISLLTYGNLKEYLKLGYVNM